MVNVNGINYKNNDTIWIGDPAKYINPITGTEHSGGPKNSKYIKLNGYQLYQYAGKTNYKKICCCPEYAKPCEHYQKNTVCQSIIKKNNLNYSGSGFIYPSGIKPPTAFEVEYTPTKPDDFTTHYTFPNYNPHYTQNIKYMENNGIIPNYYDTYEQYLQATKPK